MKPYLKVMFVFLLISVLFNMFATSHEVPNDTTVATRLGKSISERPIEKLYVHQDRTCYVAGETIWLKVYQILSASARDASGVVYVDLVDGKGEVVVKAKYPLSDGQASGSLEIPAELLTGCYQIRAYTQWMLNEGTDGFFQRELKIKGLTGKPVTYVADSSIHVRFFPEGGDLVEGLVSKVAIEAVDGTGKGILMKGTILDSNKEVVQRFQTNAEGLGSFFFQPQIGQHYSAKVDSIAGSITFPKVLRHGLVLNLKRFKEVLRVLLTQNQETREGLRHYSLVFHQGGQVLAQLPVDFVDMRANIDVPIDKLPTGVFTMTVIDENYQVYCERLAFARYPETLSIGLTSEMTEKEGRQMMTVNIDTHGIGGKPCPAHVSLAVVDGSMEDSPTRTNFKTYLFLESELRGRRVEHLSQFWKPDTLESLSDIELLLLTRGWCRYSLNHLQGELKEPAYPMEQGLSIGGKVEIGTHKAHGITVQAVLRQDSVQQLVFSPLDKNGHFALSDFSFEGTKEVMFSATDTKGQTFPIVMDAPVRMPPASYIPSLYMPDSFQTLPSGKGTIRLDEVKVTARKMDRMEKRRSYSEGFVKSSFDVGKNNYGDMRRLLQRVPGLTLVSGKDQSKGNLTYAHMNGTPNGSIVTFVLDGFVVKDSEMVYSMDVSHIERIEVLQQTATMFGGFNSQGGIVAIYTKEIGDTTVSNKQICQWVGFNQTKEFYVPALSDSSFIKNTQPRHTLYWNPNITTDESGKAKVSFWLNNSEVQMAPVIHSEGYSKDGLIGADYKK